MVGRGLLKINQSILAKDLQGNVVGIIFTTSEGDIAGRNLKCKQR